MMPMTVRRWCALTLWLATATLGACSDDDDDSGAGASASEATAACHAFCDAEQAAQCMVYASVDECRDTECDDIGSQSAGCTDAIQAYYDCLNASDDVCAATCSSELSAAATACS